MSGTIQVAVPKHIGDAMLALPALRMLASGTGASVRLVCSDRTVLELLADQGPWAGVSSSFARDKASIAVLFGSSFRVALQARVAGVPVRLGRATDARRVLLSHVVPEPPQPLPGKGLPSLLVREHQGLSYRRIAAFAMELLGHEPVPAESADPVYRPGAQAQAEAHSFWQESGRPGVLLHPFAKGLASKRWPSENWRALGRQLKVNGAVVLVSGGPDPDDARDAHSLASYLDSPCCAGPSTLSPAAWAALARLCGVVVLCDTGLAHLSAAAGLDPVVLFGPTDPRRHGPVRGEVLWRGAQLDCAPCYTDRCRNAAGQQCMELDAGAVVRRVMARAGSGPLPGVVQP